MAQRQVLRQDATRPNPDDLWLAPNFAYGNNLNAELMPGTVTPIGAWRVVLGVLFR